MTLAFFLFLEPDHRDARAPSSAASLTGTALLVPRSSSETVLPSGEAAHEAPRPAAGRPRAKAQRRRRRPDVLPPRAGIVAIALLPIDRAGLAAPARTLRAREPVAAALKIIIIIIIAVYVYAARTTTAAPRAAEAPHHGARGSRDAPAARRGGLVAPRCCPQVSVLARFGVYRCACDEGEVQ